jgi:hypothetical protein
LRLPIPRDEHQIKAILSAASSGLAAARLVRTSATLVRFEDAIRRTMIDLTDFKRDLSELSDRLGHAQDCL